MAWHKLRMVVDTDEERIHFIDQEGDEMNPDDVREMIKYPCGDVVVQENFSFVEDYYEMDAIDERYCCYVFYNTDDCNYYSFRALYDSWEPEDWDNYEVVQVEKKTVTKWVEV